MSPLSPRALEACDFLRTRYHGALWPSADQEQWFAWYWTDARVMIARADGAIVAAGLMRAVDDVQRADADPAYTCEGGTIAYIDAAVNTAGPRSWDALLYGVHQRFPNVTHIAFHRLGRLERVRIYPINEFRNRITKHHG